MDRGLLATLKERRHRTPHVVESKTLLCVAGCLTDEGRAGSIRIQSTRNRLGSDLPSWRRRCRRLEGGAKGVTAALSEEGRELGPTACHPARPPRTDVPSLMP
jgi:hypothetical protein